MFPYLVQNATKVGVLTACFCGILFTFAICDLLNRDARDARWKNEARESKAQMEAAQRAAIAIGEKCKSAEQALSDCERGAK